MTQRKKKSVTDEPVPTWVWYIVSIIVGALVGLFLWSSGILYAVADSVTSGAQPVIAIVRAIVVLGVIGFLYFLPSVIGYNSPRAAAIIATNFLLGWTFIGWVIAFIWALAENGSMNKPAPPPS